MFNHEKKKTKTQKDMSTSIIPLLLKKHKHIKNTLAIFFAIQIVFHEEKHKTRICHLNPVLSAAVRILKTWI